MRHDRERARSLARWQPEQPTLDEVRRDLGGPGVDDDELLLRYFTDPQQVAAMRAAGPVKPDAGTSLQRLLTALGKSKSVSFVSVQKADSSVTVQRSAPAHVA